MRPVFVTTANAAIVLTRPGVRPASISRGERAGAAVPEVVHDSLDLLIGQEPLTAVGLDDSPQPHGPDRGRDRVAMVTATLCHRAQRVATPAHRLGARLS